MSEAKHTPGPWYAYPTEFDDGTEAFDVMCDGAAITIACPPTEADARLISAAPELLEALEALVALVPAFRAGAIGANGSAARAEQYAHVAAEDAARAAIAKAKGTA